jgi:acetyltransferase-like isoleucine patch superfamily enzyme/dTDP-4-dehydrorhamnose 3,5-epimerase-like enzyme
MSPYLHPQSLCESEAVGDGTRVWAFAHVLPGAVIGRDCNVCDSVFIENDVVVGDRVTIKCGVQLWDGVRLEDDVFVGPNATFTNDPFPRSKRYPVEFPTTVVRRGASIGANATILPGLTIGRDALVGAGSVVTRDVPDRAVVVGNPARVTGYTDTTDFAESTGREEPGRQADLSTTDVSGARLVQLDKAVDMRGALIAGETARHVPFDPQRFFVVHDVPTAEVRGAHAHRQCEQFLVCLRGSVHAIVDDGTARGECRLDDPRRGLYMPAMTWGTQYRYSEDAVLLVLASHPYDADDYIRDYDDFLREVCPSA